MPASDPPVPNSGARHDQTGKTRGAQPMMISPSVPAPIPSGGSAEVRS